jgi:bacteriocin biosynthesis cyclodehydratase domain-containing protein
MRHVLSDIPLRLLPIQVTELHDGVALRRGSTLIHITGEGLPAVFELLLESSNDEPMTVERSLELFPVASQEAVARLMLMLLEHRILVPAESTASPEDHSAQKEAFYWNFGKSGTEVASQVNAKRILIIGVNTISWCIAEALADAGYDQGTVLDCPTLRNQLALESGELSTEVKWPGCREPTIPYSRWEKSRNDLQADCIIATSDCSGPHFLRQWNQFCSDHKLPFFGVVLHDLVGYLGPFVTPGVTACYECLRARQNSHLTDPRLHRRVEYGADQHPRIVGLIPALSRIVGNFAALEVLQFLGAIPGFSPGYLTQIELLAPAVLRKRVLKIWNCSVCSPLNDKGVSSHELMNFPDEVLGE